MKIIWYIMIIIWYINYVNQIIYDLINTDSFLHKKIYW